MSFAFIFESVGGTEWFVLLGVILIVVGPKNLPAAARKLGQVMANLRRAADEFKRQLMTMDQEVRSTVNDAISVDSSSASNSSSTSASSDSSSEGTATDEGGNPYPEGSPYPGHEDFYDETSYDDGYGEDGSYGDSDGGTGDDAASQPEPAAPAQPPLPTDEELRRVTITVSSAPEKSA